MLEKIGNNPLLVSLITIIITTILGAVGYLIKQFIEKNENDNIKNNTQQSNIIQNFNSGITYNDLKQIVEDVVEDKLQKYKK